MSAPVASDVAARLGAFLNMEPYAIETRWVAGASVTEEQAHHQVELECRGALFAAGRLFEECAPRFSPQVGPTVVRAALFEAIREIADSDPMHQACLRDYTIRKWIVTEGALRLEVRFTDFTTSIG